MNSPKPYLIIGNGQVGAALTSQLGERANAIAYPELDFTQASQGDYEQLIETYQPQTIINAAAYTQVDKAEEERELAMQVNAHAVGLLAKACAVNDVLLAHYSTDYVFSGKGDAPWHESDATYPVNYYGETKLAGEQAIQDSGCKYFIFRISWVYDEQGSNFVNTMLRLGSERESLNIVSDQIGAPCYAGDVAAGTLHVLSHPQRTLESSDQNHIYHMCNAGETSWYEFALEVFNQAHTHNQPMKLQHVGAIPTSDYPTPAKRPLNSRLNTEKLALHYKLQLPHWQDGLKRCMEKKYAH